jgi:hypothetical protein
VVLVVVAGLALITAAFLVGQGSRGDVEPEPSSSAGGGLPALAVPASAEPSRDPVLAAQDWLRAFRTVVYTDPMATAWTVRVQPIVTGELAQQVHAIAEADGGALWTDFVARQCSTATRDITAVVPGEGPRSAGSAFVQVSGEVVTTCAGDAPEQDEQVAATVEVRQGADGLWRVAKRLY